MNGKHLGLLYGVAILSLLQACGTTRSVTLVPDRDGHTGSAEVRTAGGSAVLDQPRASTRLRSPEAPPGPVRIADQKALDATFGEALSVEPQAPARFTLLFETGKTVLTPESEAAIATIVETCRQRRAISIAISGHTDAVGSDLLNDKLARDRAERVSDLLQHEGIDPDRIAVTSHGKGNPAFPTPDGTAEPRNRRVDVVIH